MYSKGLYDVVSTEDSYGVKLYVLETLKDVIEETGTNLAFDQGVITIGTVAFGRADSFKLYTLTELA